MPIALGRGTQLVGEISYMRPCDKVIDDRIWIISKTRQADERHKLPENHKLIDHIWTIDVDQNCGVIERKSISAIAQTVPQWINNEKAISHGYHAVERQKLIYDKLLVGKLLPVPGEKHYKKPPAGHDASEWNSVEKGMRPLPDKWIGPKAKVRLHKIQYEK